MCNQKRITMKINLSHVIVVIAGITLVLLSCQKEQSGTVPNGPRPVAIYLTDHATPVFDSLFIDIQRLEIKVEDDALSNDGWISLNIRTGVYNILRFRNGLDTLFGTGILPNTRLRKIRLGLGQQNSAMLNGQSYPLRVNDNDRQVEVDLDDHQFEITPDGRIVFWIDFDAGNSIQVDNSGSGNNNGYRLRSHLRIFSRSQTGRIEGKVFPQAADAIIKAYIGSDTATAIPDNDGEFKIVGLSAGNYSVLYDGQNGYRDTVINNVIVRTGEDTRLRTVTLHQ